MLKSFIEKRLCLSTGNIVLLLSVYFYFALNLSLNKQLIEIISDTGFGVNRTLFALTIPFCFIAIFNFLFSIFAWKWVTKPFFSFLLITSSVVSYVSFNYGLYVDYGIVESAFETHSSEALSYVSFYSTSWVIIFGVLPSIILCSVKINNDRFLKQKFASMLISLVVVASTLLPFYKDYSSVGRNNSILKKMIIPTQFIGSTFKYIKTSLSVKPVFKTIGDDAQIDTSLQVKPKLVVMIMGETARAQNYTALGYDRNTTPFTSKLDVTYMHDVASCGTATAVSLPCLFSRLDRESYDRTVANSQSNALDVLAKAGVDITWIDNDGGDKGVARRQKYIEINPKKHPSFCDGEVCVDSVMLPSLDTTITSSPPKKDKFIILHLIGSHGPTYFKRYPKGFERFSPSCNRADIENCSDEMIRNTYDNTIAFTDYVVASVIDRVKKETDYDTAVFYLSDHGESLGESGIYLHGLPYRFAPIYQKRVPMMFWMSPEYKKTMKVDTQCLRSVDKQRSISHDNVFDTLLGMFNVETKVYQNTKNLISGCSV
ncbi:phosphoethanolamine transferase [Photobacterium kishitanii]|uniref:Phosphoethanolamine transferase n=1 Tax=Photobacterium kishitanii TaxID=318456 RepID=A0A2T3KMP6_9GAMM|nr:phosphoethanolamine--lipid A transferase [Photobacterium kishitanii]PSV01052.1 phosphoethanolamine transferase [Photobacterium kishitanii]